jgi:hypothetical protein
MTDTVDEELMYEEEDEIPMGDAPSSQNQTSEVGPLLDGFAHNSL